MSDIAGVSIVHPEIGKPQHLLIRYADGRKPDRWEIQDDYAARMGANMVLGAVANINSKPQPAAPAKTTES